MTRRTDHFDAMLKHLGATYYQTLRGQGTPSDVARALESVDAEAARRQEAGTGPAGERRRGLRAGRWRVRDVMTTKVITVDRQAPGRRIAWLMKQNRIHAVPVVTGGRRVAGVVTEDDLLRTQHPGYRRRGRHLLGRHGAATREAHTAARLMTSPAITIHPDAPIGAAARRMAGHHLTLLPVVDSTGELIGVVTRMDLLGIFLRPDAEMAAEVTGILAEVLLIEPDAVTVSVNQGVVTLSGELPQASLGPVAVRLAESVDGVLAVEDKLSIPETAPHASQ